ncbi:MAG TPA: c-type cytochrome, partial [Tepidisphaeraceae bacterium]|nr:c-type cytochrome [Tepidisphaeraceae bacterium]
LALTGIVVAIVWSSSYVPLPPAVVGSPLDMARVAAGHRLYMASCAACHGADARGVEKFGKNLRMGLAYNSTDESLQQLIIRGRQPGEPGHTTNIPMPPRGGRDDFGDSEISDIVVYLRSLQDPTRVTGPEPEVHVAVLDDADPEPVAAATPVAPSVPPTTGDATSGSTVAATFNSESALRGKRVYMNCIACHGKDGAGLKNLGADLLHSKFVSTSSDEALLAFIKTGRVASDPASILKLNMPAKGGNPALKDNQIQDVIAYVRSLQAEAGTK